MHRGAGPDAYPGVVAGWRDLEERGEVGAFRHLADDVEALVELCQATLAKPALQREDLARAAAAFVLESHTEAKRVRSMLTTIESVRRLGGDPGETASPHLGAFLPEVDVGEERPLATRNRPLRSAGR